MNDFVMGTLLFGSLALACETQSPGQPVSYGSPSGLLVTTPDGLTFRGYSARAEVYPRQENLGAAKFVFGIDTGLNFFKDPAGHFRLGFQLYADNVANPEVLDLPIAGPTATVGDGTAGIATEKGAVPSGLVHLEFRAGRVTGSAETPEGTYHVDGMVFFECFMIGLSPGGSRGPDGSPYGLTVDEAFETPLCQRFASLRSP